jgi:hypothetical protein
VRKKNAVFVKYIYVPTDCIGSRNTIIIIIIIMKLIFALINHELVLTKPESSLLESVCVIVVNTKLLVK